MKWFRNLNFPTLIKALQLMGSKGWLFNICIFLFCTIEVVGMVLYTYGIQGVVSSLEAKSFVLLRYSVLLILINHVLWWVYAPISTYLCSIASRSTVLDIRTKVCESIIGMEMEKHDRTPTGELLSVVSNDVSSLERIYDWSYFQVLRSALGGIGGVVLMVIIDWRFALVVFILGTMSVYTTSYFSKQLEKIGDLLRNQLKKVNADAYELIKAAKTIRLLKLFNQLEEKFQTSTELEAETKIKSGMISARMNAINIGISSGSYIAILFIGGIFVYLKLADWGTVIALAALKDRTDMLFLECGEFIAGMQKNIVGVKRLFNTLEESKEEISNNIKFARKDPKKILVLRNVSFSYNDDTQVIKDFSMILKKNKVTVLFGESGSGKSTLMKLILGLYHTNDGSIDYEGEEEVTLLNLRNKTAYVPQEAMLFRGSIFENIAYGKEDASMDEVVNAAKLAGADTFIESMDKGYNSMLLDDGIGLSGGQKQRISIARALIKHSPILLLDEITSALDEKSEKYIFETLRNISKKKTVLLITHNKDATKWADEVYVLW